MSFYKFLFSPKLFKEYGDITATMKMYESAGIEKLGENLINFWSIMFSLGKYGSPLIMMVLYKKGFIAVEGIQSLCKFSTGIGLLVVLSYCIRGLGRQRSASYRRFVQILEESKANYTSEEMKKKLRMFDFEFEDWPVDWSMKSIDVKGNTSKNNSTVKVTKKGRTNWISPCSIAASAAIHTFGIKLIYPGSVKIIQKYLHPMLVQGRSKLIESHQAVRNKVETIDGNFIDTIFVDNRDNKSDFGKTLVITAEGNAGFYEIGIVSTPLELNYSVLGFNHPGFAGSTGSPFPDEDQNAIDAVLQFAIQSLGFIPENILLFGWSIGGYSSLWLATQYPSIKGVILDATFDDLLYLALPRMPESISDIVKIAIRQHVNLNNNDLITKYNGPVLLVRRTEDEVICTEELDIGTNRGNYLLLHMLKFRFPNIFKKQQQVTYAGEILNKTVDHAKSSDDQLCLSLLLSFVSENVSTYPLQIGEDYSNEQKNQMVLYLVKNHLMDYKSSHCTPLPADFIRNSPWNIPNEDFVFT